jgi:hypothetical protein
MRGSIFVHLTSLLCCFGSPRSIRIPATVRRIGNNAVGGVNSLADLTFEEGVAYIGEMAFFACPISKVAFPASLEVIDKMAFHGCGRLREIAFARGSKLQCIHELAFSSSPMKKVVLPATVKVIHPSAFTPEIWGILRFDGPPPVSISGDFLCSGDSKVILYCFPGREDIEIPPQTEVIAENAFADRNSKAIFFESGSKLREIGKAAFQGMELSEFTVPASVEIIGDRCFERCFYMARITFEENSRLRKIGERAFAGCGLKSITIPASTEEIDGYAFMLCPLLSIQVLPGSQHFATKGDFLFTANGTEIVRYIGREGKVIVPKTVEVLGKSCFEGIDDVEEIEFESGSTLKRIGPSALCNCSSLTGILIPASVVNIEKSAFRGCRGLEACLVDEKSVLVRIGDKAFAGCLSLRSFDIGSCVKVIGQNCFRGCVLLHQFRFGSVDSLKAFVGTGTIDESLENLGFTEFKSEFKIKVDHPGADLNIPEWFSFKDQDSHLTFTRALQ